MSFSNAPISFPGLFGDWQFTVPSKALNIGNGIYWYGASSLPRACCWDSISA